MWTSTTLDGRRERTPEREDRFCEFESRIAAARQETVSVRTPILFVHGAFGGAWTWTELFVLRAAKRGRPSVAFSVRGHGRSEGRDFLRSATLTDYTDDLRRTLAQFVAPAIGVAHSLGALLAQRLLGHVSTRAMIMLAPSPAEGLSILLQTSSKALAISRTTIINKLAKSPNTLA